MLLSDGLESVDTGSIALADLHDFAEAALSDDSDKLEVIDGKRLALEEKRQEFSGKLFELSMSHTVLGLNATPI